MSYTYQNANATGKGIIEDDLLKVWLEDGLSRRLAHSYADFLTSDSLKSASAYCRALSPQGLVDYLEAIEDNFVFPPRIIRPHIEAIGFLDLPLPCAAVFGNSNFVQEEFHLASEPVWKILNDGLKADKSKLEGVSKEIYNRHHYHLTRYSSLEKVSAKGAFSLGIVDSNFIAICGTLRAKGLESLAVIFLELTPQAVRSGYAVETALTLMEPEIANALFKQFLRQMEAQRFDEVSFVLGNEWLRDKLISGKVKGVLDYEPEIFDKASRNLRERVRTETALELVNIKEERVTLFS